jgi:hypothetical protein
MWHGIVEDTNSMPDGNVALHNDLRDFDRDACGSNCVKPAIFAGSPASL